MKKVKQREFQLKFKKMKDEVCEVEGKNGAVGVWMPMDDYLNVTNRVWEPLKEDARVYADEWDDPEDILKIEGGSVKVNGMDGEMINVSIPKGARIVFDTPTPPW